jgi:hypothetical protein
VVVHFGETKVFEGQLLKIFEYFLHALAALFVRQENFLHFLHVSPLSAKIPKSAQPAFQLLP